jgi:hypothetical protein
VYNCAGGHNESTKTILGGSFEIGRSWSVEVQAENIFGLFGPKIKSSVGTTKDEIISQTQTVEVNIPPGLIVSLFVALLVCSS